MCLSFPKNKARKFCQITYLDQFWYGQRWFPILGPLEECTQSGTFDWWQETHHCHWLHVWNTAAHVATATTTTTTAAATNSTATTATTASTAATTTTTATAERNAAQGMDTSSGTATEMPAPSCAHTPASAVARWGSNISSLILSLSLA